ncbi:hypothetical protein OSTOST_02612, partial [Ostertagia ostertagi]
FQLLATPSSSTLLSRVLFEQTRSKLIGRLSRSHDNLMRENEVTRRSMLLAKLRRKSSSSTLLGKPIDDGSLDNDQTPVPEQAPVHHITQRSVSYVVGAVAATDNNVVGPHKEIDCEVEFKNICNAHKGKLSSIFDRLGLDWTDAKASSDLKRDVGFALKNERNGESSASNFMRACSSDNRDSFVSRKVDNGHRIKFIAPDEGFSIKPELVEVFEEIRMWETFDSIPYNLYQTMKSRLHNGMDKIADRKTFLCKFEE